MEHLKFVVLVLKKKRRLYGYIFKNDFESEQSKYCRFVEHKNIQDYLNFENLETIVRIDKSEIIYIDNNLRF